MKLLCVNGCIRGKASRTWGLTQGFLAQLQERAPNLVCEVVDLNALKLAPLYEDTLAAREMAFANGTGNPSLELARQFQEADYIVLAAPFWEGTFPAALHTYLEHICVTGLTFSLSAEGYQGLCRAQRAVFITTRGGIYESGPAQKDNHAPAFLTTVLTMLGIPRLDVVAAEGLDIWGFDAEGALAKARTELEKLADTFIA